MIFSEGRFFVFLAIVFAVHRTLRADSQRKLWLLAASFYFYGAWDWRFLFLLIFSIVLDFTVGLKLASAQGAAKRRWMAASVCGNLGLLGFFKYWDFFASSAATALSGMGLQVEPALLDVVLPAGISFYTFQTLTYTLQIYRGELQPVRRLTDFALFVSFFPHLVAGPIMRASHLLPQFEKPPPLASIRWRHCVLLFLMGFVKKACVADQLAPVVERVFSSPDVFSAADKWLAAALYSVQIYCDFSGYSDMAIALAGVFGYRLVLNFDFPYLATSITEFWRRWHISLSTWFRDYLYVPLGGNRKGPARTYFNLVVVFFLCGLWHGADWKFVVWGLFHGVLLLVERAGFLRVLERLPGTVRTFYVWVAVLVGWVLFRAESLGSAARFLAGMFGASGAVPSEQLLWPGLWLVLAALALVHAAMYGDRLLPPMRRAPAWAFALVVGAFVALVVPWVAIGYVPFIYFQF